MTYKVHRLGEPNCHNYVSRVKNTSIPKLMMSYTSRGHKIPGRPLNNL